MVHVAGSADNVVLPECQVEGVKLCVPVGLQAAPGEGCAHRLSMVHIQAFRLVSFTALSHSVRDLFCVTRMRS